MSIVKEKIKMAFVTRWGGGGSRRRRRKYDTGRSSALAVTKNKI